VYLVALIPLFLPPGVRPWPPPDPPTAALIREAGDGNRAGVAAVRSLACKIDESWKGRVPAGADEVVPDLHAWDFWMDGDAARVRNRVGPEWAPLTDTLHRGGRELTLFLEHGRPDFAVASRARKPQFGDARWACLFACWDLHAPDDECLTLAEVLDRPHEVWAARRVTEDGVASIYLDLAFRADRLRLWLDPANNYLVWKAVVADGARTYEYRVTDFRRAPDGAALPVRVERRISFPKVPPATLVTTLSDVHLNEPLSPDVFRIPGLAGLRCRDELGGQEYRLDENGKPAGPWRAPSAEHRQDRSEPDTRRVARYILAGVAGAGLLMAVITRWRRRRWEQLASAAEPAPRTGPRPESH
jgi:hypothetical protein